MKIALTILVLCCLAVAGVGGTLATWSDSETSEGNTIITGSVDLKVEDSDDLPYGTGVPTVITLENMMPGWMYGYYAVDVWNAGVCTYPSKLYMDVKSAECSNVPAKEGSGYADPNDGVISPEPELVAQYEGKVNCTPVEGVGVIGEDCTLLDFIYMEVVDGSGNVYYQGPMSQSLGERYITDLIPCNEMTLYVAFFLLQPSEEYFGVDYIPDPGDLGYDYMHWVKFNDWPSWGLMKDKVVFNVEFDLWLDTSEIQDPIRPPAPD
jgi:predicted ribosomally synthesized peptide with SipW-like signal peptide